MTQSKALSSSAESKTIANMDWSVLAVILRGLVVVLRGVFGGVFGADLVAGFDVAVAVKGNTPFHSSFRGLLTFML